jgi:mRNA-degrading endonuclease toxin of MazEF toxin-antitoxin module
LGDGPDPDRGGIQGDRYAIVVRDVSGLHQKANFVFAVPVTSFSGRVDQVGEIPFTFTISAHGRSGLFKPCKAIVFQFGAYKKNLFGSRVGLLEDHLQTALKRHLHDLFGGLICPPPSPI